MVYNKQSILSFLLFFIFLLCILIIFINLWKKTTIPVHKDVVNTITKHNLDKCCLIYKHTCFTNGHCKKGIQKRCGKFANTPCDKTLASCNYLSKEQCVTYPNNVYCSLADNGVDCIHKKGIFGEDINCDQLTPDLGYNQIGCDQNVPSNQL